MVCDYINAVVCSAIDDGWWKRQAMIIPSDGL
jgi:hypothetical protein